MSLVQKSSKIELYFHRTQVLIGVLDFRFLQCNYTLFTKAVIVMVDGEQPELPLPSVLTLHLGIFSIAECLVCLEMSYAVRESLVVPGIFHRVGEHTFVHFCSLLMMSFTEKIQF